MNRFGADEQYAHLPLSKIARLWHSPNPLETLGCRKEQVRTEPCVCVLSERVPSLRYTRRREEINNSVDFIDFVTKAALGGSD